MNGQGIADVYELTPLQQGMLFHGLYASGSATYNIQIDMVLEGELDERALEQSWGHIVERHAPLRTAFVWERVEKPYQVVRGDGQLQIVRHDLSDLPRTEQDEQIGLLLEHDRALPFDLKKPPLMRLALVSLDPHRRHLVWTFHHIILEGWSASILLQELWTVYRDLRAHRTPALPAVRPYVEYVRWLENQDKGQAENYWRHTLKGFCAATQLPIDKSTASEVARVVRNDTCSLNFSDVLAQGLKALGRKHRVTLNTIIQGMWSLLLSRYSGETDVVYGAAVSGRPPDLPDAERIVGLFVNVLPVRSEVPADKPLGEWLRELQLNQVTMRQYEYSSLMQVKSWSDLPGGQPIFTTAVSFENWLGELPTGEIDPGLKVVELNRMQFSDQPLALLAAPGSRPALRLMYDVERFERDAIERMLVHCRALLEGMVAAPESVLGELSILSVEERRQLLEEWNVTRSEYPRDANVVTLFEEQVERTPEALAAAFGDRRLSYAELNDRANRLAHYLKREGVGPDVPVAVMLRRSMDMVISWLAILKAGGAYLPLDPEYPQARLWFMLEDSQSPILLTEEVLRQRLPEHQARAVFIDTHWERIQGESQANLPANWGAENLAYIVYTSGSTGQPKGVGVPHRAVVRLVRDTNYIRLGPQDRVLQASNASFDAATFEVWGPLLNGGSMVGVARDVTLSPHRYKRFLAENGISVLFITTALFNQVARQAPDAFCSLGTVLFGGEMVDVDSVRRVMNSGGRPGRLLHVYGPTESTTFATWYEVETVGEADVTVPIGRPLANTELFVLDSRMRPVPVGVQAELYVGGDGLARGYWRRPELTAQKFVAHPYSAQARLYRTGDLVRWRADGVLEILGRTDDQVKLRGFRIELGEIEASLRAQSDVRDAVVMLREDAPGDKRLVAYVVPATGQSLSVEELRAALQSELPAYMVPAAFVPLPELPLTPNGKVDRDALPLPDAASHVELRGASPRSDLERRIANVWCSVLKLETVGIQDNFFDVGGHSLLMAQLQSRLREEVGIDVPMVELFRLPTVEALARHLNRDTTDHGIVRRMRGRTVRHRATDTEHEPIAIVGMAGRFPGARDVEQFWRNLRNGVEGTKFFSDEELLQAGVPQSLVDSSSYVKAKGLLEDAELFDAAFFGYTPREAGFMDPQHRLFLECAWQALETAGYDAKQVDAAIGVYAGTNPDTYFLRRFDREQFEMGSPLEARLGSDVGFLATRVSYKLGLKGPSVSMQTACSTSLVATCHACESLASRECDMALVGAATVTAPRIEGYLYQHGGILSPDGRCRPFDADARGTIPGEGVAVVVLRRLSDAIADGDTIHAVIKGWALNNDGDDKVGFTAPSVNGQAEVIAMAHASAGVEADSISYVETHGTGTELGDPIEIAALMQAFGRVPDGNHFCAIGSVKSNIGHLDATAGVAGLIKTVLALAAKELPPHLHFKAPNPRIPFEGSPFYVNAVLRPWPEGKTPRRAGVSSFGIGGTNAHVVLEEAPVLPGSDPARPHQLLQFSARSPDQLKTAMGNMAAWLKGHSETNLADVAHTLRVGRRRFQHAATVVCQDVEDAIQALEQQRADKVVTAERATADRPVVFMFPGQGNQYVNMGRDIYASEPIFREHVDRCCDVLQAELGMDLRNAIFSSESDATASERLRQTGVAQPALFVIEYALARLLMDWGVQPQALIGHSIGEYVAACLGGVFTLHDALKLVAARGRLMQSVPPGAMTAVALPQEELMANLGEGVSLAAVNEPTMCVASGSMIAIERLESQLADKRVTFHRLHTSHAFHSDMMQPVLAPFADIIARVRLAAPSIPFISNVTGGWITAQEATTPDYWVTHLRQTVRFADGMHELLRQAECVLLEVGPGTSLRAIASRHPARREEQWCVSTMRYVRDTRTDRECLLESIGRLWLRGAKIDWRAFQGKERRRRISLPTYPFERQHYWLESHAARNTAPTRAWDQANLKRPDMGEWFYVPSWKRLPLPAALTDGAAGRNPRCWLIFVDACGVGERLSARLDADGHTVFIIRQGMAFAREGDRQFSICPQDPSHYATVLEALETEGIRVSDIVHLWAVDEPGSDDSSQVLDRCFYSLMHIAQAVGATGSSDPVCLHVVSKGVQVVTGDEQILPEKATLLGPCAVIPEEYEHISCRSVDVTRREIEAGEFLIEQLLAEFERQSSNPVVAYRGTYRWVREYEPQRLEAGVGIPARLRRHGVYLITGGLGGVGLALADYLAKTVAAKLVLVGRTPLASREGWDQWLASHDDHDAVSQKIRRIRSIEAQGAEVMVASADVASAERMHGVVERARERFGTIHGVIHAAGVPAGGLVQLKTREQAARILAPKVQGTRVLERLFRGSELDFFLLCSSLVTVSGAPGQVDYAAANAFLDAYAHHAGARIHTVSVNWDTWRDVGMAVNTHVPEALAEQRARNLEHGIGSTEGAAVLDRILRCSLPQVVVSTRAALKRVWRTSDAAGISAGKPGAVNLSAVEGGGHRRPRTLAQEYVRPRDDAEEHIARIWRDLFGIAEIGVEDGFFDLGGHSLLAIQIVSRIKSEFPIDLTLNEFFDAASVARLAARVRDARKDSRTVELVVQVPGEEVQRVPADKGVSM